MKCSKCGFNVPRGSKFCTNCGAIIKKHIARKVVASLIVIVLASGIVGGAFAWRKGIFPISKENNNNDISTTNNTTYENDESIILSEGFTSRKILDKESALAAIGDVADILGINDVYSEFGECKENTVEGNTYYRFYQEYNGIPVYGRSIIVCADENGDGQLLCGNFEIIANGEYESNASIKDIIGKLVQYLDDNNVKFNPDFFESLTLDQLEKCIYITEHNTCTLAYMIPFDYFEIIVDAISADILCMNNLLNSEKGYLASDINRINEFNVEYTDDGYTLIDSSRNITVMTLNGTPLKEYGLDKGGRQIYLGDHLNDGSALLIVSEDNVFGNNTREMNLDYETGAKLLINGSKVYDYFHNNFGYENSEMLKLYFNDGFDDGNNALGGIGIISMGKNTGVDKFDILCHEYTHNISRSIVGWVDNNETSAINEAVSDILGEISEAHITNSAIDWSIMSRDIINYTGNTATIQYCYYNNMGEDCPIFMKYGQHQYNDAFTITADSCIINNEVIYPTAYQGKNWNSDNDSHINSILVSHAAYLMTQGNGTNKPLSTDQLAHLIYQSLYSLPSDCNFEEFRKLVESTANIMSKQGKLTTDQLGCISWAFDQVGITSSRKVDYYLKQNAEIIIYDINAEPYNNYKIDGTHIDTVIYQGPKIPTKENEKFEYVIDTAEPFIIPYDSGVVLLNITDCGDSKTTYSLVIGIDSKGKDSLDVYTDFGKYESKITDDYLKNVLHTVIGGAEIADFCMEDFDCNGSLEAFAAVVRDDKNYYDEALYDLYFVTEKTVEKISEDDWLEFHENNLLDFGNKKYYVVENCFTSSSTSRVYGVEGGVWFEEPSITRRGGWITQITETNSMTIINDFDYDGQSQNGNGTYGHTWKTHYIYWDNGFKEYGGIHISESQLLMCDGAEQYVDMIKDSNGEISGILYRENGVININYCLNSADGTTFYENMTLKLDGAKVTAVVRKDWTDSIEKYSEGGVYSEAFIPEIASYPDSFIFSIAESTPSSGQCGDTMYWKYNKDSETLEISGSGDMYDYKYTTPYEYGYNPPWNYWSQNERISNIKFNGEINEIGIGAFCYCEDIETISLPVGIKHIDEGAFDMCEGLKYVSLPEGLDNIGKDAFLLCRKLSEIHLPKSLNYIDQGAFNCCDSLTDVYYYGSKSDWKDIVINNDNDALLKANIHFMGPSSYLEELEIIQRGQYDENMGDSFVLPLGSHHGYIDINGNEYKHGIECWIARWNFTAEQSWAYSTFKLDGNYSKIDGKCVLIQSYNTSNFDTTLEFYGDDKLIASYHLTPDTIPLEISLDVTDVNNLTVYLADNVAVEGGTAFGLIDMSLNVN